MRDPLPFLGIIGAIALAAYLRSKRWIDRLAGSVIGLLGLRLLAESGQGT